MRGANPLVQAPHVPKRAPDWGQFVEGAAATQSTRPAQGGRQAARAGAWGQVTSNPYQHSSSGIQQGDQSTGPLKPAWLPSQTPAQQNPAAQQTQQQRQPQQHTPAALQHEPQDALQQHTAPQAALPARQQQKATTSQHRPTRTTKPTIASAQRGLGSLQGNLDTELCDNSFAALDGLLDEALGQPEQSWQQQAGATLYPVPAQPPVGQRQTVQQQQQQQHDQHIQQQQQQQQLPKQQQRQRQGFSMKPVAAIAAWGLDDTDDVQLPDSWFDSIQVPAPGSNQAAAAPGSVSANMDWGTGAGKQQTAAGRQVRADQHASASLQQRRQPGQAVAQASTQQQQQEQSARNQGQQQQQQQMQQQHAQGSNFDCLQQQAPWLQVQGQHTPSATSHQVPAQHSACQPGTQALQQQQQPQPQQRQLPWQQQQVSPQVAQAPVRQRHTAAGSVWSSGVNLAALNRVPAAAAASAPSLAREKPAAGAVASTPAAAAAAAVSGDRQPAQKPQSGSKKAAAKGGKKGKGSISSSSGISMEFVPNAAAATSLVQPELHQMDLFETLKRARRNKQREQQQQGSHEQQDDLQDDMYQQQQQGSIGVGRDGESVRVQRQDGKAQAGSAAAKQQGNTRKRKRASVTAAEAAPGAGSGCAAGASGGRSRGAASGGGGGSSGSRAAKAAKLSKAAAAALEGAVEELDTWSLCSSTLAPQQHQQQQQGCVMLDASMPGSAAWQQLQQALLVSEGVALGLLYSRTVFAQPAAATAPISATAAAGAATGDSAPLAVQYCSSLQAPSKQQLLLLSKAASIVKKQAAKSAAAAAEAAAGAEGGEDTGQAELSSAGVQQVVGLAVMPVLRDPSSSAPPAAAFAARGNGAAAGTAVHGGRAARGSCPPRPSYYVHLQQQDQQQQRLPPHVLQLLHSLLCAPDQRPCVCCGAKDVLCSLMQLGLQLPAASCVNIIDPELLGWLSDPQCIQDTKDEACYALEQQLARCNIQVPAGVSSLGPLQRLHTQLSCCLQLTTHLHSQLSRGVAGQAIKLEMQVCTLLAKMQACGVACAPSVLAAHRPILAGRLAAIKASATQLVGRDFNLSSSSQLAKVLYEDLRLVPPAGGGGRGAAKTHLPTNEATLKQLAQVHQLPALVLEHRCILNVMSKWIDAAWVQQAAQQPGGRVHCTWQQAATATGRLSSCGPNLQAVTKYTITAQDSSSAPSAAADPQAALLLNINVRDAFVAPPGKLLLSADYSQIELRLLAHCSEDALLRQILSQETGDVFNMIAAALQKQAQGTRPDTWLAAAAGQHRAGALQVSAEERERAKRVVYGIVYGQTPFGLAQSLADQGISTKAADGLIDSFLARFPGVRQFMQQSIAAAHASGAVSTLMGRHRPISGLAGDFHKRSEAERKVVNSQIQGSAADLIKLAMCAWEEWAEQPQKQLQQSTQPQHQAGRTQLQQQPHSSSSGGQPAARLIAQIHDELLFEVPAHDAVLGPDGAVQHPGQSFLQVAAAVKAIMEGAAALAVPLRVKLAWGNSWGSLADLQL